VIYRFNQSICHGSISICFCPSITLFSAFCGKIFQFIIISIIHLLIRVNYNLRFVTAEYFIKSRKLPKPLKIVAIYYKRVIWWKKSKIDSFKEENETSKSDKISISNEIKLVQLNSKQEKKMKQKRRAEKEKNEKQEFDSNVAVLNHLMFVLLLLVIFGCNSGIWITIGN
jgi:hypothetical protein